MTLAFPCVLLSFSASLSMQIPHRDLMVFLLFLFVGLFCPYTFQVDRPIPEKLVFCHAVIGLVFFSPLGPTFSRSAYATIRNVLHLVPPCTTSERNFPHLLFLNSRPYPVLHFLIRRAHFRNSFPPDSKCISLSRRSPPLFYSLGSTFPNRRRSLYLG